jgi:hypothetical protein
LSAATTRISSVRYAGSFRTLREAKIRRDVVAGSLASLRLPELRLLGDEPKRPTVAARGHEWLASRIDVAESTKTRNGLELDRIRPLLGARRIDELTPAEVAAFVVALADANYSRGTIRKTLQTLAMILDRAGIDPNPARDKQIKLPRGEEEELNPPTAEHVEAVYRLLPSKHRLPLLWLDWSGARVSSVDLTLVSDYDEPRRRVRLRATTTKTLKALWVGPAPGTCRRARGAPGPPRGPRPRGAPVHR